MKNIKIAIWILLVVFSTAIVTWALWTGGEIGSRLHASTVDWYISETEHGVLGILEEEPVFVIVFQGASANSYAKVKTFSGKKCRWEGHFVFSYLTGSKTRISEKGWRCETRNKKPYELILDYKRYDLKKGILFLVDLEKYNEGTIKDIITGLIKQLDLDPSTQRYYEDVKRLMEEHKQSEEENKQLLESIRSKVEKRTIGTENNKVRRAL